MAKLFIKIFCLTKILFYTFGIFIPVIRNSTSFSFSGIEKFAK